MASCSSHSSALADPVCCDVQADSSGAISFREFNKLLRQGSKQGVKKKKWAPSEALEDVLSLPALKKEVMRECSKLSTNLLDR